MPLLMKFLFIYFFFYKIILKIALSSIRQNVRNIMIPYLVREGSQFNIKNLFNLEHSSLKTQHIDVQLGQHLMIHHHIIISLNYCGLAKIKQANLNLFNAKIWTFINPIVDDTLWTEVIHTWVAWKVGTFHALFCIYEFFILSNENIQCSSFSLHNRCAKWEGWALLNLRLNTPVGWLLSLQLTV